MPSAMRFGEVRNGEYVVMDNLKYKYDVNGNISEVWENGKLAIRYFYDALNRLVREDNKPLSKTVQYSYDNNGNIILKRVFAFTLKDTKQLEELESTYTVYTYDGDKLMSYGNEKCVYDAIGNPTTYRGKACTWERDRQLTKYKGTTFKYNGKGRRSGKGMIFFLYDHEGKLVTEGSGLEFIYDDKGVVGFNCSGETLIYRKNIQGDIIAILDNTGRLVVKYNYDAWGNHEIELVDSSYADVAEWNPFRYRGYYYDVETGLYYLNSRYYDPETGRFISSDDLSYIDPDTINGLNLYAYCSNNPVMNVDPSGHFFLTFFAILGALALGAVIGGVSGGLTAMANGSSFWSGFAGGAVSGLITTMGLALAVPTGGMSLVGGLAIAGGFGLLAGFTGSVIQQGISNDWNFRQIDYGSALVSGVISAVTNMLTFGISSFAMKQMTEFSAVFNQSLSFGTRFIESLSFSPYAVVVNMAFGFPFTTFQMMFEILFGALNKNKSALTMGV